MLVSIQRLSNCVSAVLFCHLGSGSQRDHICCYEMLDYRLQLFRNDQELKASLKQTRWHGFQQSKPAMNN